MTNPKAQGTVVAAYEPKEVEAKWTKFWFDNEVFNLDINPDKPKFSIALPPPNITGNLHMGHALNGTLQDVLIRLKRMQGYNVHWQPGTDHAGISTQMVVERKLKQEGINRHQLGREKFIEKVWEWRKQYGDTIMLQYQRLGVSFNWDRVAFTMDESYTKAIYRAFVTLYREGHIYRGKRVTNWCPRCLTSLSDLEVVHVETQGHLYLIKYPLTEGVDGLTVATTRPETLFGDVAVAVNPNDERYKKFIGKTVELPLTGRTIPVIADDYIDREFGTGVLKITPACDANDWEVGQRHKLDAPVVIDERGNLCKNEFVPEFAQGKERFAVRDLTVEKLTEAGLLVEARDYTHGVGQCERCNTVIEPYLSEQWYLRMKELAQPAIEKVKEGRIQFIPERYEATFLNWMENIRDWNISRQLWWGHRIPVWTCADCNFQDAFEEPPTNCTKCSSKKFEQDPDVLDTWFSSALWPFATLGWPDETEVFKAFYPTTVLSTAREIINLWVSRMIFTSLHFVKTIPFKHVLIHPVIQTTDGKRMSKSKGNAVDPLVMIDKYGADANRFLFASIGVKGDQDVRFREEKLEEYRKFANKLFNAGRFVLTQLEGFKPAGLDKTKLTLADKWIMHRYTTLLKNVEQGYNNYDFHEVAGQLYEFIWDYFCDWYLEIAKLQIAGETAQGIGVADSQTRRVLHTVFEGTMRALHPIMPFITEDLYSRMPKSVLFSNLQSLMFAPFPRFDSGFIDQDAEDRFALLMRTIRSIRNLRQTFNVPTSATAELTLHAQNDSIKSTLELGKDYIRNLSKADPISVVTELKSPPEGAREEFSELSIYVSLRNLIDVSKSREKLLQRKQALEKDRTRLNQTLDNPDFKSKAPRDKVVGMEAQLVDLDKQLASIDSQLKILDELN